MVKVKYITNNPFSNKFYLQVVELSYRSFQIN